MPLEGPIPLEAIKAAREGIADHITRTPLVRLYIEDAPAEVYLKLETLQPIGSFKLRGASNAMLSADPAQLAHGVWTASAGNIQPRSDREPELCGVTEHSEKMAARAGQYEQMPDEVPVSEPGVGGEERDARHVGEPSRAEQQNALLRN